MPGATQIRNSDMVNLLRADFQHRNEPNFAWKSAASMYQMLPGLRGYWPMSVYDENGAAVSLAGYDEAETTLSPNGSGSILYGCDGLVPYVEFVGQKDLRHSATAHYDVTGAESYIKNKGVTVGGWFYTYSAVGTQSLVHISGSPYPFFLHFTENSTRFTINGSLYTTLPDSVTANKWLFVCGRFVPGASISVFVNSASAEYATTTTSLGSGTTFMVSIYSWPLNGRASNIFFCASALSDAQIFAIFDQTRAMYKV